jgi:hypothetical protein
MADISPGKINLPSDDQQTRELQNARDLYARGDAELDRQAAEIFLRVFQDIKNSSGSVALDKVDYLPQLVQLLVHQGLAEKAGEWAATLFSTVQGKEQWLKRGTLHDCFVWASKGLATAGRFEEARRIEAKFVESVAPRLEKPGFSVAESFFRTAVYYHQEGHSMRALINAARASDIGWQAFRGSRDEARGLFELLSFVKHLQDREGAPERDIQRTKNRLREAVKVIAQGESETHKRSA